MNFYTDELSLFDFAPSDPVFGTLTRTASVTSAAEDHYVIDNSPPRHRHDGASPLPLGLDWSPPPLKWVSCLFLKFDPIFHVKLFAISLMSYNCGLQCSVLWVEVC